MKNGLPYIGYASAPTKLNLSPEEIISRRYGGNFKVFSGRAPQAVYYGEGKLGKQTARGLEQRYYEDALKKVGGDKTKVANKQNPVGIKNPNRDAYLNAADEHLGQKKSQKVICNS